MTTPKVSIILPVYNAEKTLSSTIHSLEEQSLKDIQIVCIDDGSSDNSLSILRHFAERNSNIIVIPTNNQGVYKARKKGIAASAGEYIAFCDADDKPHPALYESLFNVANFTHSDIVVSAYNRIVNDKIIVENNCFGKGPYPVTANSGWITSINTSLWNKLFKRDLLENSIDFETPPRIMEDALLLFLAYSKAKSISFIPKPLYDYFYSSSSTMNHASMEELSGLLNCWKETRNKVSKLNPGFEKILDLAVFIHMKISASLSLSKSSEIPISKYLDYIDHEINKSFPYAVNSPFMKRSYIKNHKTLKKIKFVHTVSQIRGLSLAIRIYSFLTARLRYFASW